MTTWIWKTFYELSLDELYQIMALRQDIFMLEQKCLYRDLDGHDQKALHLIGCDEKGIAAYLRFFPAGSYYPDAMSLGRVLVSPSHRGRGLAKEAMREVDLHTQKKTGKIQISAQLYLKGFYEGCGYRAEGEPYDEDGIPHLMMVKNL